MVLASLNLNKKSEIDFEEFSEVIETLLDPTVVQVTEHSTISSKQITGRCHPKIDTFTEPSNKTIYEAGSGVGILRLPSFFGDLPSETGLTFVRISKFSKCFILFAHNTTYFFVVL